MKMMTKSTSDGWMKVKLTNGQLVSLPEYCAVEKKSTSVQGRDTILIEEGMNQGKEATLAGGNLVARHHKPAASVQYYVKSNVLSWTGGPSVVFSGLSVAGGIPTFTRLGNEVPVGRFNIEMPDFPHGLGSPYKNLVPHTLSWFRLATPRAKDRYLHAGTRSDGCATVGIELDTTSPDGMQALKNFERLYSYLIQRRSGPGVVGKMDVFPY